MLLKKHQHICSKCCYYLICTLFEKNQTVLPFVVRHTCQLFYNIIPLLLHLVWSQIFNFYDDDDPLPEFKGIYGRKKNQVAQQFLARKVKPHHYHPNLECTVELSEHNFTDYIYIRYFISL